MIYKKTVQSFYVNISKNVWRKLYQNGIHKPQKQKFYYWKKCKTQAG